MTPQSNPPSSPINGDHELPSSQDPPSSPEEGTITEYQYRKLKSNLKECLEINKGITGDLNRSLQKIKTLRFERNILLDKLQTTESTRFETHADGVSEGGETYDSDDLDSPIALSPRVSPLKISRKASPFQNKTAGVKRRQRSSGTTTVISAPPKRNRNPNVKVTTRRIQPVPRDDEGRPIMPLHIGVFTVEDFGHVVWDRPGFHTERYIWPVGYTITRSYPSMIDANSLTTVRATILDDGGHQPLFKIECEDCPNEPIVANSATGAWTAMVKRANEVRGVLRTNSASGPDYYGLGHATIASLIQELDGASKCKDYVWQQFEAMQDRAAKGVMKACAKKRGNLEKLGSVKYRMAQKSGIVPSSLVGTTTTDHDNHPDELEQDVDMEPDSSILMDEDDEEEQDEEVDELEDFEDDDSANLYPI
ncbi:F/Y rich C-terminus-domain-containing protein [Umbelopsis sp. AD052]|nr:F/Y rich C-terminus-domain-containing protein [Umbelopsis sp. AD052]